MGDPEPPHPLTYTNLEPPVRGGRWPWLHVVVLCAAVLLTVVLVSVFVRDCAAGRFS